jgi:hypothetical protein
VRWPRRRRRWRRTHYRNFAVWLLVLLHGLAAGADRDTLWGIGVYALEAGAVGGALVWRSMRTASAPVWAVRVWTSIDALLAADLATFLDVGLVRGR